MPFTDALALAREFANTEIVHIGDPIDRWVLRRFNDVTHLD